MNRLIINVHQIRANAIQAQDLASARDYEMIAVLKGVQTHAKLIKAIASVGVRKFAFSSVASIAALSSADLPPRDQRLLLGPSAPGLAEQIIPLFGQSTQSTPEAIGALAKASLRQGLNHGIYSALKTADSREGMDPYDHDTVFGFASHLIALGLRFEGLAANFGCTQLEPVCASYFQNILVLQTSLSKALNQPITLSLGGSFLLSDLPVASGKKNVRVGELLLTGSEPAGRMMTGCASAFTVEAAVVEVTAETNRFLVDIGSAVFERGSFVVDRHDTEVVSMSGEFMVLESSTMPLPNVGDTIGFTLGYGSLKTAITFPHLTWVWR